MARSVDHLVLASRDLPELARIYGRLGFTVGQRNRHPWGTENHIVQLEGSFLELIGLGAGFRPLDEADPAAPFANRLARLLERSEGLAQVALQSHDAAADAVALAGPGKVPRLFGFGRTAAGADGVRREVAFSLAFPPPGSGLDAEFFACQHHHPENFWAPALQQHPNTARRLIGIVMAAEAPQDQVGTLETLFGSDAVTPAAGGVRVAAGAQSLEILRPEIARDRYGAAGLLPGFGVCRVGVGSLDTARSVIEAAGLAYESPGDAVVVGPATAGGVSISFERAGEHAS